MNIGQRKLLMAGLVTAYVVQTGLVYTDETHHRFAPLSPLARQGRELWHQHNCFTCHQLYGFGGFLGPDLTNVSGRVDRERFDQILTRGSDQGLQMPAFHFSPQEIDALVAFFENVHGTGVGQAQKAPPPPPDVIAAAIDAVDRQRPMDDAARRGYQVYRTNACIGCHRVLFHNCMGMITAPDLSVATTRLSDAEIDATLVDGRLSLGMPPSGLDAGQRREVTAWLHWLAGCREDLLRQLGEAGECSIPWWEFGAPASVLDK